MSINFYDKNEGIEKDESIDNYKELFTDFTINPPTLDESLEQIFISGGLDEGKINLFIKQLRKDCEDRLKDTWKEIKEKNPSLTYEQAIIISSYTCEAIDRRYSPFRILNRNLVSQNRKEGLKKVSKYFFLLLSTLRLLPRYYPPPSNNYLYRCINTKVNLMLDPEDENVVPYIRGKNKTFWAFTSTSPNFKKSTDFLGKNNEIISEKEFKKGTIFSISGKVWGYDITLFNVFKENEVLLEPERKYYIDNHFPEQNDLIYVFCQVKDTPIVLEDIIKVSDSCMVNDNKNIDKPNFVCQYLGERIFLTCKWSTKGIKRVEVGTQDYIGVLKNLLPIKDNAKFIFNGVTYQIKNSILTFEEIGLNSDSRIFIISPAIAG